MQVTIFISRTSRALLPLLWLAKYQLNLPSHLLSPWWGWRSQAVKV